MPPAHISARIFGKAKPAIEKIAGSLLLKGSFVERVVVSLPLGMGIALPAYNDSGREAALVKTKPYDRAGAVSYAHAWAYGRNPRYYDFEKLGGDCTNFCSQSLYAGAGVMNPKPTFGWYYYGLNNRAPAWTGVQFLYNFLVNNRGVGPVAAETDAGQVEPGDIVQLSFDGSVFVHSPVIVSVGEIPSPANILVAAHTFDVDNRPLDTYTYERVRYLHITHVNTW